MEVASHLEALYGIRASSKDGIDQPCDYTSSLYVFVPNGFTNYGGEGRWHCLIGEAYNHLTPGVRSPCICQEAGAPDYEPPRLASSPPPFVRAPPPPRLRRRRRPRRPRRPPRRSRGGSLTVGGRAGPRTAQLDGRADGGGAQRDPRHAARRGRLAARRRGHRGRAPALRLRLPARGLRGSVATAAAAAAAAAAGCCDALGRSARACCGRLTACWCCQDPRKFVPLVEEAMSKVSDGAAPAVAMVREALSPREGGASDYDLKGAAVLVRFNAQNTDGFASEGLVADQMLYSQVAKLPNVKKPTLPKETTTEAVSKHASALGLKERGLSPCPTAPARACPAGRRPARGTACERKLGRARAGEGGRGPSSEPPRTPAPPAAAEGKRRLAPSDFGVHCAPPLRSGVPGTFSARDWQPARAPRARPRSPARSARRRSALRSRAAPRREASVSPPPRPPAVSAARRRSQRTRCTSSAERRRTSSIAAWWPGGRPPAAGHGDDLVQPGGAERAAPIAFNRVRVIFWGLGAR